MSTPSQMRLHSWKPTLPLRPFISHFAVREASLGAAQIYYPLPARNDCFLEFYLRDPFRVVNVASGQIHDAPRTVLVGPHDKRREDLIHAGTLKVFHIGFTPVGFSSIFQIPARSIANLAESADCVLGSAIHQLQEQLEATPEDRWLRIAEQFLSRHLVSAHSPAGVGVAAKAADSLLRGEGSLSVSALARSSGKSVRQLERVFEEHVGVTPKLFSRVARLNVALQMSQRARTPDWAAVAIAAGDFDQSHMGRDYRDLTGETPAGFKTLQSGAVPASLTGATSHSSYRARC